MSSVAKGTQKACSATTTRGWAGSRAIGSTTASGGSCSTPTPLRPSTPLHTAPPVTSMPMAHRRASFAARGSNRGRRQSRWPPTRPNEVYPTCFSRRFEDHPEVGGVSAAAPLLAGSPQAGVMKKAYLTATGRLLARSTLKGSDRLEHATFAHDVLGRVTSMTRYTDAPAGASPGAS